MRLQMVGEVVGHRKKRFKVPVDGGQSYEVVRMAVEMEFEDVESGKKSKAVLLMGVDQAKGEFPIGDGVHLDCEVRQMSLDLNQRAVNSRETAGARG